MHVSPGDARLAGTVRTFNTAAQDLIESRMRQLIASVAGGFGATARLTYDRVFPATINTPQNAAFVADVATELVGRENVLRDLAPSMGSEDFSYFLQKCPGAYFRLGQGGAEKGCALHNSNYDFNDAVIPLGSAMMCALVERGMPLAG
jgi:hippurate hydrolase